MRRRLMIAGLGVLLLAAAGGLDVYLHSAGFRARAEQYVLRTIERRSGARARVSGFELSPWPLTVGLHNLVLHGREAQNQPPLAVIPEVHFTVAVSSLWRRELQLDRVTVRHPRIRIYRLADGGMNLPRLGAAPSREGAVPMFALGVHELVVSGGEMEIIGGGSPVRFSIDLALSELELSLRRQAGHGGTRAYEGRLRVATVVCRSCTSNHANQRASALAPGLDVQFLLAPDALHVESFDAAVQGMHLRAHGWIQDFAHPRMQMRVQAGANLDQLDRGSIQPWLKPWLPAPAWPAKGLVQGQGEWDFAADRWAFSGGFALRGLQWAADSPKWEGSGQWTATARDIEIPALRLESGRSRVQIHGQFRDGRELAIEARLAGLRLTEVRPWLDAALRRSDAPPGVAAAVKLLRSDLSGRVGLRAERGRDRWQVQTATADLQFAPPPSVNGESAGTSSSALPLSGILQATLQPSARRIVLKTFAGDLAGAQVRLAGQMFPVGAVENVQMEVSAQSADWSRLRPLAGALLGRRLPPFGASGGFAGTLQGRAPGPTLAGKFQLSQASWGDWSLDRMTAQGALGPAAVTLHSLLLEQGGASLSASGTIGLTHYRPDSASRIALAVTARRLDLTRLMALANYHPPTAAGLDGRMDFRARMGGIWAQPEASGSVAVREARWHGQPVRRVAADFRLHQNRLTSDDLSLELANTRVTGRVTLGLRDRSYAVQMASTAVELSDIAVLQSPRLAVRGRIRFQLNGHGSWDHPQASLVLTTLDLRGGGESLGDIGARMELDAGKIRLQIADILPNGSFNVEGDVGAVYPYVAHLRFKLSDYDFDAWLRRFTPAQLSGHSQMSGSALITGPLGEPALLGIQAEFNPVEVAAGGLRIHNQGPVRFRVYDRQLRLEPAHVIAPDTDFTLAGTAAWSGSPAEAKLDGGLQGRINLALLHVLHPATHAGGVLAVRARLGGTVARPDLSGQVDVQHASLGEEDLPIAFDNIEGQLRLQADRVQIVRLDAQTGGGRLALTGFASRSNGVIAYDLNAVGQNMRLRYQGISATGDLDLRLAGQSRARNRGSGALLSGSAQLNRIGLDRDFDLAVFLAQMQEPAAPPPVDSVLNRIRLDVHLTTGPQVEVATNLARLQLQADLRLAGTLADPSALGRAGTSEGQILFAGNLYRVTKAQVRFSNPLEIEPLVDIGLDTTIQQYDISLNLSGPADRLAISYRSDPPLSSADVVALLATGTPTQATTSLSGAGVGYAGDSQQLLGQALNNLVASRLHRLFGVTQVQVNPDTAALGPTGSGGAVTIQQQVARNLKLTYTQNLSSSSQDIIQVDWTIDRDVGISVNRDQYGLYGIQFTFRHRAR